MDRRKNAAAGAVIMGVCLGVLCVLMPLLASGGERITIKGVISGRDGDRMIVKGDKDTVAVVLSEDTKVSVIKGLVGVRKEEMGMAALTPGLRVEVSGEPSEAGLIARSVKFTADDLRRAQEIEAATSVVDNKVNEGLKEKEKEIAEVRTEETALEKRVASLGDYDVRIEASIYFDINSTALSPESRDALLRVSGKAKEMKGYLIQVAGYTDATGTAKYNQALSDRRAEAVVAYLRETCGVPLSRVLAPAAMGMSQPVASNESAEGRADNRRVAVKVMVNRGLN